jgi:hypothetical protein
MNRRASIKLEKKPASEEIQGGIFRHTGTPRVTQDEVSVVIDHFDVVQGQRGLFQGNIQSAEILGNGLIELALHFFPLTFRFQTLHPSTESATGKSIQK